MNTFPTFRLAFISKIHERDAKCNKIICKFQKSKMKAYIKRYVPKEEKACCGTNRATVVKQ